MFLYRLYIFNGPINCTKHQLHWCYNLNLCSKIYFILILLLIFSSANAQSITGMPGYIHIPTANFNPDGTLYLGSSFLPKKYLSYTKEKYDAVAFYSSLTFLPFLEVNFRATRILNLPHDANHTVDRMPSLRIRICKERKYIPAMVIGAHDFITSLESGDARHFGATYLVLTKGINIDELATNIETTVGYGTDWLKSSQNEFIGLWGGMAIKYNKWDYFSLLAEYDGKTTNTGVQLTFFKHIYLSAGMLNFNSLTGSISYHIYLINK